MRSVPFFAVLLSTTLFSGIAAAQNYVPAKSYNNPDVVVNMDVIGAVNNPYRSAPIVQPPAPMPMVPVLNRPLPPLRPPGAMPHMADRVPMPLAAPIAPPMPVEPAPVAEIPPVREDMMDAPPALAKMPPPPSMPSAPAGSFSAREMALSAPTAARPVPVPAIQEMPKAAPQKSAEKPQANPARELLAAAREEAAVEPVPVETVTEAEKPREVVIFDEPPAVPKPAEKLNEPKAVVAEDTPMALAPPSVIKEVVPIEKVAPPAPAPEKFETAALNPAPLNDKNESTTGATLVDDFEAYRLNFGAKSAELAPSETAVLDKIAAKLKAEDKTRLQLRAYADGTPDTASAARRLSLTRALAVRGYLADKGISSSRLDVRALGLGNAAMGDAVSRGTLPADRVDVIFVR